MEVWIIGGFLGAGKTTLMVELAKYLVVKRARRLAIVVNDFSDIGVDERVLKQVGPAVYELFSGCVCCQLASDLVRTLEQVRQENDADLVLVEPSGVSEPARIVETLRHYGRGVGKVRTAVLVDATRFGELYEALGPLLQAQIQAADLLAINKVDLAAPDEVEAARVKIAEQNPMAVVLEVSVLVPGDVRRIAEMIGSFEGPSAYAASIKLAAPTFLDALNWKETVSSFVGGISEECSTRGAVVMGHVKAFAEGGQSIRLFCSSTGSKRPPTLRDVDSIEPGAAPDCGWGTSDTLDVCLNAIVYGLSQAELRRIVLEMLGGLTGASELKAELHEAKRHREHQPSLITFVSGLPGSDTECMVQERERKQ